MRIANYLSLGTAVSLIAFLFSCTQQEQESPRSIQNHSTESIVFTATTPGSDDFDTKSQLDPAADGAKILWSVGDRISIFYGSSNVNNMFTSENTEPVNSTTFTGSITAFTGTNEDGEALSFWGVFPYRYDNTCDGNSVTAYVKPSVIGYPDDIQTNTLVTIAKSYGLNLAFKNACSGFKLGFAKEGIRYIVISSDAGEPLAGYITVTMNSSGVPEITEVTSPVSTIQIDLTDNPSEIGKYYYIPTIPGTLSEGFTMTLYTDTQTATYVHGKSATLTRSKWARLAPEKTEDLVWEDLISLDIPADEIWYTSTDGNIVEPSYSSSGYTILSNTYDADLGYGIIKYDKDLNTITGFSSKTTLLSVTIPSGVHILSSCFSGCTNLQSITLPDDLKPFGTNAVLTYTPSLESIKFWNTGNPSNGITLGPDSKSLLLKDGSDIYMVGFAPSGISSYTIPSNVTHIADQVFYRLTSLEGISFGSNLVSIGNNSFANTSITGELDLSNVSIGTQAFFGAPLSRVILGDDVSYTAFLGCSDLEYIGGSYASSDNRCYVKDGTITVFAPRGLTSYTLPSTVTKINHYTFAYLPSSFTSLTVDENCTEIGASAFSGSYLQKLTFNSEVPPTLYNSNTLSGSFTIYVPEDALETYKTEWADYEDRIEAAESTSI